MEKLFQRKDDSFCDSDTDSAEGENDFLYELIFGQRNKEIADFQLSSNITPLEGKKSGSKANKNAFKNGRMSTKLRKTLNNLKRETESPFRKVLITTDLKCTSRSSKSTTAHPYFSIYPSLILGLAGGRRAGLRGAG